MTKELKMIKLRKKYLQLFFDKFHKTFSSVNLKECVKRKNKDTLLGFTLILSFFVFNACGGKSNDFGYGYGTSCSDYTIDVRPAYSDQTDGQTFTVDLQGEGVRDRLKVDGITGGIGGNTLRLELEFVIRNSYSQPVTIYGVGTARNLNFESGFKLPRIGSPFNFRYGQDPSGTIRNLVRDAIRDGYKNLNLSLADSQQQISSTVSKISGDQILIPLGTSDYIQKTDIFYIHPGSGGYNYNSSCNNRKSTGPPLATASVIDINTKQAILQIDDIRNRQRQVKVGDAVEISPDIDIESRYKAALNQRRDQNATQTNPNFKRRSLKIGFVPPVIITFRPHNSSDNFDRFRSRITRRNISPMIRSFLSREARNFGFQIVR